MRKTQYVGVYPSWRGVDAGRCAALIIILSGMILRLALVWIRSSGVAGGEGGSGEADNVARAIASGRGFADPYFIGSGATAHLMPTTPLFAGYVFRIFGADTPMSAVILILTALAEVSVAYFLLYLIGGKLSIPRLVRLAALAWLSFIPIFFTSEAGAFRFWEGGLALALALGGLYHVMTLTDRSSLTVLDDFWAALLAAATFFVSPILGLAVGASYSIHYIFKRHIYNAIRAAILAIIVFTVVFSPWVIRNYQQFDRIIPLRDNAGLELAIANYENVLFRDDVNVAYWARLHEIHPLQDGPGRARVRKIGEVAYFDELKIGTQDWIVSHPDQFLRLYLRHILQMVVPPAWNFGDLKPQLRASAVAVINVVGILSILLGMALRKRNWIYPGIFTFLVIAAYGPFQPVVRYYYPLYILLTMCAVSLPYALWHRWSPAR